MGRSYKTFFTTKTLTNPPSHFTTTRIILTSSYNFQKTEFLPRQINKFRSHFPLHHRVVGCDDGTPLPCSYKDYITVLSICQEKLYFRIIRHSCRICVSLLAAQIIAESLVANFLILQVALQRAVSGFLVSNRRGFAHRVGVAG